MGAILYYSRSVENKLIIALSAIEAQKEPANEETAVTIVHILNYVVTYPNNGITYHFSVMVIAAHADSGY